MGRADDILFDEADLLDARYYCPHGNFVGNPYGADYLCGWCEDGTTDEEFAEILFWRAHRETMRSAARQMVEAILAPIPAGWVTLVVSVWQATYKAAS